MAEEQEPSNSRLAFHAVLKTIVPNVYFQEPKNTSMVYPCILYKYDDAETEFADNLPYRRTKRYSVTLMDWDPDSPFEKQVASLPMSAFDRTYAADNLNHFVFSIYF